MAEPNDFAAYLGTLERRLEALEQKAHIAPPHPTPNLETYAKYIIQLEQRVAKLQTLPPPPPPAPPVKGAAIVPPGGGPVHVLLGWQPSRVELWLPAFVAHIASDGFYVSSPIGSSGEADWTAYH
jgi:hypothetical protein